MRRPGGGASACCRRHPALPLFPPTLQLAGLQAKYREALAAAGTDNAECLFGLAESLQEGAEATLAACAALPDAGLSAAAVQQADSQAEALLQESVAAYRRVLEGGEPRVDALVCAGNALR